MSEVRPIPGYEGRYTIDDTGVIRAIDGTEKFVWTTKQGYRRVPFKMNGKTHKYLVHRLVWAAFKGEIPEGYNVHHINGDKADNRLENLELMRHGKHSRFHNLGEKANGAYLTEDRVREIRELARTTDLTDEELAEREGLNRRHVTSVINGHIWGHVGGYVRTREESKQKRRMFSDDEVREIRRLCATGKYGMQRGLAKKYGVSHGTIQQIANRVSYADVK